eukprot:12430347-Karenia_brevis.AAC.1
MAEYIAGTISALLTVCREPAKLLQTAPLNWCSCSSPLTRTSAHAQRLKSATQLSSPPEPSEYQYSPST